MCALKHHWNACVVQQWPYQIFENKKTTCKRQTNVCECDLRGGTRTHNLIPHKIVLLESPADCFAASYLFAKVYELNRGLQEGGRWFSVIVACDIFSHGCFSMFNEGRGGPQLLRIYTLFNLTFRFKLSFALPCRPSMHCVSCFITGSG